MALSTFFNKPFIEKQTMQAVNQQTATLPTQQYTLADNGQKKLISPAMAASTLQASVGQQPQQTTPVSPTQWTEAATAIKQPTEPATQPTTTQPVTQPGAQPGTQPGTLLTPLEQQLLQQNAAFVQQQAAAQQQAQQQRIAQQATQQGLSQEATAGMQQQAAATVGQSVLEQVRDISNTVYGSAMERASGEQAATRERWYDTISANAGNPDLLQATIDASLMDMPGDTWLTAVKANPELLSTLTDAARAETTTRNRDLATQLIKQNIDPLDSSTVTSTFDGWMDRRYADDDPGLAAEASAWATTWTDRKQDIADEYEERFGVELDPASASDLKRLYAYSVYKRDVDAATADQLVDVVATELRNSGMELSSDVLESVRKVAGDMQEIFGDDPITVGGVTAQWSADLDNGPFSIHFTGWDGNPISLETAKGPVDEKLDTLWKAAWAADPEGMAGVTRDDFVDAVAKAGFPSGPMSEADADRIVGQLGFGIGTGAGNQVDKAKLATMPQGELQKLAADAEWWNSNSTTPKRPAGEKPGLGNWGKKDLRKAYEMNGWKKGNLVQTSDGTKMRLEEIRVATDSGMWDDTLKVYAVGIDLETGERVPIYLGRHDT